MKQKQCSRVMETNKKGYSEKSTKHMKEGCIWFLKCGCTLAE